jgi:antitoxin component YwqK of YwqJK toxin-antitoxin module
MALTTMDDCTEVTSVKGDTITTLFTVNGVVIATRMIVIKGQYTFEGWYKNGLAHRDNDLPAKIEYKEGQKIRCQWCVNGKWHRSDDLPAIIHYTDGQKTDEYWYKDNQKHRLGDPAMIRYKNGQKIREEWWNDGKYHNLTGPAVIRWNEAGSLLGKHYYINGVEYKLDQYRDLSKSDGVLAVLQPIYWPIRDIIWHHYCQC